MNKNVLAFFRVEVADDLEPLLILRVVVLSRITERFCGHSACCLRCLVLAAGAEIRVHQIHFRSRLQLVKTSSSSSSSDAGHMLNVRRRTLGHWTVKDLVPQSVPGTKAVLGG